MWTLNSNFYELKGKAGIFVILSPDNEAYIGKTKNLYNRFHNIKHKSKLSVLPSVKLYYAITQYGLDSMKIMIFNPESDIKEYLKMYGSSLNASIYNTKSKVYDLDRSLLLGYIYQYGELMAKSILHLTDSQYDRLLNGSIPAVQYNSQMNKSTVNTEVMALLNENYNELHSYLKDEEVFNDTVLSISYKYNPDIDFVSQFIDQYRQNLIASRCNKSVNKYLFKSLEDNALFKEA